MTYALFEDSGKLLTGKVLSLLESSAQVELETGKRLKVKAAHILLQFDKPEPAALIAQSQALCAQIDLAITWEFAPESDFSFLDLAREYFSNTPSHLEQAAMLMALHGSPHYFRRAGHKGQFKKADAATLAQALAALERKKLVQSQIDSWAQDLANNECPAAISEQIFRILFKPDKNGPEYKAVVQAARSTGLSPLVLLKACGAIGNPYQFHWQRFLFDTNHPMQSAIEPTLEPLTKLELPAAQVRAFSIDDSGTTEIDDALSVQGLGSEEVTLGIHIAAPGLATRPADSIDKWARQRLSTVYVPGQKITMLPSTVVSPFTLEQGASRPAVSLYVRYQAATFKVLGFETKIERVPIFANLRYDLIDSIVSPQWLTDVSVQVPETPVQVEQLRPELMWLFSLAQALKQSRELVRGKPETFNRPDYSFKLDKKVEAPICGDELVTISPRVRGAPLDLIVAECMIVANSTWGGWLATLGVPAIYRSQASLGFGSKVRMSTHAAPHAGIGVPCYAWSTSPLRRYTDLVNQWQIIAAAQTGMAAALAAPFKPKDAELLSIIASFEDTYATYRQIQNTLERFWTLKYLEQHAVTELVCTCVKDDWARANDLPLALQVLGAQNLPRGSQIRIRINAIDLIALDVSATLLGLLEPDEAHRVDPELIDLQSEGDDLSSDSFAIAIDINEGAINDNSVF